MVSRSVFLRNEFAIGVLPRSKKTLVKVDLQNPISEGYDIDESLASYNAKSAAKVNRGETVFKVVI